MHTSQVGRVTSTGSGFNFAVELIDGRNLEKLSRWEVRQANREMTMTYYKHTSMTKGMSPMTIAVKNGFVDNRCENGGCVGGWGGDACVDVCG